MMISKVNLILGEENLWPKPRSRRIFDPQVITFLSDLSSYLRGLPELRDYPDVAAFAFWCREGNIRNLSRKYPEFERRSGLGLVFHITPSNVPVNFAFSWALSLIAGNSNTVRLSSLEFEEINIILNGIRILFDKTKYGNLKQENVFLRYEHDESISSHFMSQVDARVIWGSDHTIRSLKSIPTQVHCRDLFFTSRTSIALIDEVALDSLKTEEYSQVISLFVRDSLAYHQLGCSSPREVRWVRANPGSSEARHKFWTAVSHVICSTALIEPSHVTQRLVNVCNLISIYDDGIMNVVRDYDGVYLLQSNALRDIDIVEKVVFGTFLETFSPDIESSLNGISSKVQTICCFGVSKEEVYEVLSIDSTSRVDRIVPLGGAFEMTSNWDGYDVIRTLSRIVEVL